MTSASRNRVASGVAAAVTVFLAVAGLVDTHSRRALHSVATGSTRRVGDARLSAVQLDAQMRTTDATLRGEQTASARPALGFSLTTTRREVFEAWAYALGGHCYELDAGLTVECAELPFSTLSQAFGSVRGTLRARFDTHDRLRELTAISRANTSTEAAHVLTNLKHELASAVGPPHAEKGAVSADYLDRSGRAQSVAEYRFADYYVKISATNMGSLDGFRIMQRYRAIDD